MKRITFDLAHPDEMKSHIKEWIPSESGDQSGRLGTIEDERVLLIIKEGDLECAFEAELVIVNVDGTANVKVVKVFIASKAMALGDAVAAAKSLLRILGSQDDKLNEWTNDLKASMENPGNWPQDKLLPAIVGFSKIDNHTHGMWYELQIRDSRSSHTHPWRVTLDTGVSN
jgi:hypothetical protein